MGRHKPLTFSFIFSFFQSNMDNVDGIVTDAATDLMWTQADLGETLE